MNIFPWQDQLWTQLTAEPEKLPHALLLTGDAGLGKLAFAKALAARLLCETPDRRGEQSFACGRCNACKWFAAESHPDFRLVQPEEDEEEGGSTETEKAENAGSSENAGNTPAQSNGKKPGRAATVSKSKSGQTKKRTLIRIHQIRDLFDFVFLGSHQQGRRIVVLHPAEAMNAEAANSLLKILEEPPSSICFILVSSAWRKLLPTIRSRCRLVTMTCPDKDTALAWLKQEGVKDAAELLSLTGGAPVLAQEWARQERLGVYKKAIDIMATQTDDPVAMAAQWQTLLKGEQAFDLPQLVGIVQKWTADLLQMKLANTSRYHGHRDADLRRLSAPAGLSPLLACQGELMQLQAVARHPLNTQLFLEDMAARYARALAPLKHK